MKMQYVWTGLRLVGRVVKTLNRSVFDTPGVLSLVNETAQKECGRQFSEYGTEPDEGFSLGERGYDVTLFGGYPTIWIRCPGGYSFKVGIDSSVDAILDERTPCGKYAQTPYQSIDSSVDAILDESRE